MGITYYPEHPEYFRWEETEGGIKIVGYSGRKSNVLIPSQISGKCVIAIGYQKDNDFELNARFKIPASVERIEPEAFGVKGPHLTHNNLLCPGFELEENHPHLKLEGDVLYGEGGKRLVWCLDDQITNVTVPEGVTVIGRGAFMNCEAIETISLPESLEIIEENAFSWREKNISVQLPEGLKRVGTNAFRQSNQNRTTQLNAPASLEEIGYSLGVRWEGLENHPNIRLQDNMLLSADGKTLFAFWGGRTAADVVIPEGVEEIRPYAFCDTVNLKKITLPSTLKVIRRKAFDTNKVKTLRIPAALEIIEDEGYPYAELNSIQVDKKNPYLYTDKTCLFRVLENQQLALLTCFRGKLEEYIVPEGTVSIAPDAFAACEKLEKLTLPESLVSFDEDSLPSYGISSLQKLTIPASVKNLHLTFRSGTQFTHPDLFWENGVFYQRIPEGLIALRTDGKTKDPVLKEGVVRIAQNRGFTECNRITLPGSLRKIEPFTFWYSKLTEVVFSEGLESIGEGAFGCCKIQTVTLPTSLSFLHTQAFMGDYMNSSSLVDIHVAEGSSCFTSEDGALYSADKTTLYYFPNKESSKHFTVPESVTEIGHAFSNCQQIVTLRLPAGVKNLWQTAFHNCRNLTHLYLDEAPDFVDPYFINRNCGATIHAPRSAALTDAIEQISSFGRSALKLEITGMADLSSLSKEFSLILNDTGLTITSYLGNAKQVVIPEKLGDFSITKIGTGAFAEEYGKNKLESVEIPGSVVAIEKNAFRYCEKLAWLTLAPGLKIVGANAFDYCKALTEIVLPEGVEEIGDCAFFGCEGLRKMVLPASLKSISPMIFANNSEGLYKDLYLDDALLFQVTAGSYAETFLRNYRKDDEDEPLKIVYDLPETTPPTEEEKKAQEYLDYSIRDDCTAQVTFKEYQEVPLGIIPDRIMGLKITCLAGLGTLPEGITRISIPASVTRIEGLYRLTFYRDGKMMTGIDVSDDNQAYWSDGDALYTKDRSELIHLMNYSLTEYTVHEDCKIICEGAFGCMSNLKKLVLPEGLQEIRANAFDSCPLEQIVGADRVPNIAANVLSYTPWYQNREILFNGTVLTKYSGIDEACYRIPDGTTEIAPNAFAPKNGTDLLREVYIPDSVTVIGERAFSGRKHLKTVRLPQGLKTLESQVLYNCTEIKTLHLPAGLETIKRNALPATQVGWRSRTDTKLREITVDPDNAAFASMDGILYSKDGGTLIHFPGAYPAVTFTIPASVHTIADDAFINHTGIQTVDLGEQVKTIGIYAFHGCSALSSIDLSHVQNIGKYAFSENLHLSAITLTAPEIGEGAFSSCLGLSSVALSGTKTICDYAFRKCASLGQIILPEGLEEVGSSAFADCGLKQITLPKSVRKVNNESFSGCPDITIYDTIDPDAKPAATYCDDCNGHPNSNVGFMGIGPAHAMWTCAANHTWIDHEITVRSAETNEIKYKVAMYSDPKQRSYYCTLTSSWGKNASFNFAALDAFFSNIKGVPNKIRVAVNRLRWPVELSEGSRESYAAYLVKSAKDLVKTCINNNDMETLQFCIPLGILKKTNIDELLEYATKADSVEFAACLLNYKDEHFAPKAGAVRMPSLSAKATPIWQTPKAGTSKIGRYKGTDTVVEFPSEVKGKPITGVAGTNTKAPDNYKAITAVVLPEGYTSIGGYAFAGCENLETITLPSTLETIGNNAFDGCRKLKEIILPDSVCLLGDFAFSRCDSVTRIRLSRNLATIPFGCFQGCSSLQEMELPNHIRVLHKDAFKDTPRLDKVVFRSSSIRSVGQAFFRPAKFYTYRDAIFDCYGVRKGFVYPMTIAEQVADVRLTVQMGKNEYSFSLEQGAQTMQKTGSGEMIRLFDGAVDGKTLCDVLDQVYEGKIRSAEGNTEALARLEQSDPASAKSITVIEEKHHEDGNAITIFAYKAGKKSTMKTRESLLIYDDRENRYYIPEIDDAEKASAKGFRDITEK